MILAFINLTLVSFHAGCQIKGWTETGNSKWTLKDGEIESRPDGIGFLVSDESYTDFVLTVEFWNTDNFSGIMLRCSSPEKITGKNSYKITINRPDPENQDFITGGIAYIAKPSTIVDTSGKWNKYEITAKGNHIIVKLNGVTTADIEDNQFKSGPIALQTRGGITSFRNLVIKSLK